MKKRIFQLEDEQPRAGDTPIKVLGSSLIVRRAEHSRQVDADEPGWAGLRCTAVRLEVEPRTP